MTPPTVVKNPSEKVGIVFYKLQRQKTKDPSIIYKIECSKQYKTKYFVIVITLFKSHLEYFLR